MLFTTVAKTFGYTRNPETNISSYSELGSFLCNIQPVGTKDGFEGQALYDNYKLYTRTKVVVGTKIQVDGEEYVINSVQHWKGIQDEFYKCFISKSNGE